MSTTIYKLILVGPKWASATTEDAVHTTSWTDDDNSADLTQTSILLDTDKNTTDDIITRAQTARLLLEELEKEGNILEDALQDSFIPSDGLPVFADITAITPVAEPETPTMLLNCLATSVDTEALLRDLEAMLPEVTPPQSPPSNDEQAPLTDIDELLFLSSYALPDPEPYQPPTPSTSGEQSPIGSPYSTASPYYAPNTPLSVASPVYAPSTPTSQSSLSSPYHAPSTPSSTIWDSDSTSDPEWTMDSAPGPSKVKPVKPRAKPYSRTEGKTRQPQDRRERKKVQNKNAATRYRVKKKAEEDDLMSQEGALAEKNDELKSKVDDLANEIRIIKGLLRDQCKRLGILKD